MGGRSQAGCRNSRGLWDRGCPEESGIGPWGNQSRQSGHREEVEGGLCVDWFASDKQGPERVVYCLKDLATLRGAFSPGSLRPPNVNASEYRK